MLRDAGVGSLPGTAAEILDQKMRDLISPGRISVNDWIRVVRLAHSLHIPTTCTIMYGHLESSMHKAKHLEVLKEIQRETHGFTEFVPLSFVHNEAPMYFNNAIPNTRLLYAFYMHSCAGILYAFCLIDSNGHMVKLHINQFNDNNFAFISAILDVIKQYHSLVGYAILSDRDFISDIDHIRISCEKVGLSERFLTIIARIKILDLYKIFSNTAVKGFLNAADGVNYREDSLNAVAIAYLGDGKLDGLS